MSFGCVMTTMHAAVKTRCVQQPAHHCSCLLAHAGLIQAMAETFQGLERRLASLQQQEQEEQHYRVLLLEVTLFQAAGSALDHMFLFDEAAVARLQLAAASNAVAVLHCCIHGGIPMPFVDAVLFYCDSIMRRCVYEQCNWQVESVSPVHGLEQQQRRRQLATAADTPVLTEDDADANEDAAVAAAWEAVLHSEDTAQLAAFQLAAAAAAGGTVASRTSSSSNNSSSSFSSNSVMPVLRCWLPWVWVHCRGCWSLQNQARTAWRTQFQRHVWCCHI
jgi:hypothetical protein